MIINKERLINKYTKPLINSDFLTVSQRRSNLLIKEALDEIFTLLEKIEEKGETNEKK